MSEKLCALRKIGGGMSETVLWTNPNPTSSFGGILVTLSQSLNDFKQIAIDYRYSTSNAKSTRCIYDVDMFKTFTSSDGSFYGACSERYGSYTYNRSVYYVDLTHVNFGGTYVVAASGSHNDYVIPTQIVGLK